MKLAELRHVEVNTTGDGEVALIQERFGTDDLMIVLHPLQVPVVCKLLREAAKACRDRDEARAAIAAEETP